MIQGTMSNAGKSIVTAGILRVLKQDGFKVAPFKSQNMALNSFITSEGLEMGRAQVMQAEAAGINPSVLMNPILLKPTSDVGSQVIVNGEVLKNMTAREYFAMKKILIPNILDSYKKLESQYDYIVLEGAGSPAEINLKSDDIVNMGMAELVDAPVLLVGDIDRGGVFAQLVGTLALLEKKELARVKGLIINKFRGDKTILDPGIEMLYKKCGIPVVGVLPYSGFQIDDEDSLSERLDRNNGSSFINISVIRLPHISNFTDFNPLENFEGVSVNYVKNPYELNNSDLIILPGTKNTMADLLWLRQSGFESMIKKLSKAGTLIIGICGGYQMLGEMLYDYDSVEHGGSMKGIGILPIETTFEKEKTRTRVMGKVENIQGEFECLRGLNFEGYEIHMGKTIIKKDNCEFSVITNTNTSLTANDGCAANNIIGTYVHGIFDNIEFSTGIIKLLFERKGLNFDSVNTDNAKQFKEKQYDMLADVIRKHMDMDFIYKILDSKI